MNRTVTRIFITAGSAALFLSASVASAATVLISGNTSAGENQPGWMFNRDATTATPYVFNTDAASVGSGSLYVMPIGANASDKMIAENFINASIADVNSISYDFKIGTAGVNSDAGDEEQFYMSVYANFGSSDDLKFYDCRYSVIPTTGSQSGFTTVTFDPTAAYPVTTRGGTTPSPFPCPATPADMDTLSPGSNIRAFSINVGDTSASDVGIDGYLDRVVVNRDSSGETVYNFDPAPPPPPAQPTTKQDCMNGGWQQYGFKNQGVCIQFLNTGKDSRLSAFDDGSLGSMAVNFVHGIIGWFTGGFGQAAATIVPGQQKQMEKNIRNIDSDDNGIPDVGVSMTGKYVSIYAYDASDNWYWDLGDGRINGTVENIHALDQATLTKCVYQVQYRGMFQNDAFLDNGWIKNEINCSGYDDNKSYSYMIVHETDPRYRGIAEYSVWGNWEYKTLTESGLGNLVRPQNHVGL